MNPLPETKRIHPSLPIFQLRDGDTTAIYSPGHVSFVSTEKAEELAKTFHGQSSPNENLSRLAKQFIKHATVANAKWEELGSRSFEPLCLTVYLSNQCHLRCIYCYAAGPHGERNHGWEGQPTPKVSIEAVKAAAKLVAANCQNHSQPFQLVLHGGGEPTLHWELLKDILTTVRQVATSHELEFQSYLSTAGVMSASQAQWLADNITHIGLSTDGPTEIQNLQRPLGNGRPTAAAVEQTAAIFRDAGVRVTIRCTITRWTVLRQCEILVDLNSRLGVQEFVFEPAYRANEADTWALQTSDDAALFADQFLAAQRVADALGCDLQTSGVRLDEIHGPFCNVLRDVLQLTPDGVAVSCFVCTDGTQDQFADYVVGKLDRETGSFRIGQPAVERHRASASFVPERCKDCHNIYHCARDCPDDCPTSTPSPSAPGGFRCELQRRLGHAWILGSRDSSPLPATLPQGKEINAAVKCIGQIGDGNAASHIAKNWSQAIHRDLTQPQRAPDPLWAIRGFDLDRDEAWQTLLDHSASLSDHSPISIYVHVPFCDRKCDFCDCYSLTTKQPDDPRVAQYLHALETEISTWTELPALAQRPITTIHFGGGTPTYLNTDQLGSIVERLQSHYNFSPITEWAIESTTSQLSANYLENLKRLGFTRLHVGVQSLEESVRRSAGRRESSEEVEDKLQIALSLGMIVSVDVIYGLPGQNLESLRSDLSRLIDVGIHGVSLYRLNLTTHNRPFARDHGLSSRSLTELFFMFQYGEHILRSHGFEKTHFAHFSRPEDEYLYYRHALRGEDLLALGPTADGSIGPIHYRHTELPEYLKNGGGKAPSLVGAALETSMDTMLHPITSSLMTASIPQNLMEDPGMSSLLQRWLTEGLLLHDQAKNAYELTANGSWFINQMLMESADTLEVATQR